MPDPRFLGTFVLSIGELYAVIAYSVYSCRDAIIKRFGQDLSVFEIGFFVAVFGLMS